MPRKHGDATVKANYNDLCPNMDDLRCILVKAGLALPEEDPVLTPLSGGVSSTILRLDLASGSYCFKQALHKLKVDKDWFAPRERVFAEAAYLKKAARIAPGSVPRVLHVDAEHGAFIMEYLDSRYTNWKTEMLGGFVRKGTARKVAALLSLIHNATADDPKTAAEFATHATFMSIRLEPYLLETARQHPAFADKLRMLADRTHHTRRTLVHGDISPKNILIGPDEQPVLLDAECAWFGDPAFDLAFLFNHLLHKAAHLPEHAGDLIHECRDVAAAYFPKVGWEKPEELEQRVASLLPAMLLARIDGKSPLEYLKPEEQDAARKNILLLLEIDPHRLETITAFWSKRYVK